MERPAATAQRPTRYGVRVARCVRSLVPAAALAVGVCTTLTWWESGAWAGWLPLAYVAGTHAMWCVLGLAMSSVFLPLVLEPVPLRAGRDDVVPIAIMLVAGAATFYPLGRSLQPLVPAWLAYAPEVALTVAAYLAPGTAAVAGYAVLRRRGRAFPWLAVGLLALLARLLAQPFVAEVIGVYRPVPDLLLLFGATVGAAGILGNLPNAARPALAAVFAAALAVLCATYTVHADARSAFVRAYSTSAQLLGWASRFMDLDGDGAPAVLGGTDCDDFNRDVSPWAVEVVGNGIDDNCMGGDLASYVEPPPLARDTSAPLRNVIVITVDAWRADMLDTEHMPRVSAFAPTTARFTRAYANATATSESMMSLTTGHPPMSTLLNWDLKIGSEPSLADLLRSLGYQTLLMFQAYFAAGHWVGERGFTEIDRSLVRANEAGVGVTSEETTVRAIAHVRQLEARQKPYLAWFHYFDPHEEYRPRRGTPFVGDAPADRYRQELWSTDRDVGKLLAFLQDDGFFTRGGVLLMHGDHGELIGDHGQTGHALWTHEAVLRTPLLVRGPTITPGRYTARVGLIDIFPTVLELAAGIVAPSAGRSLSRVWSGADTRDENVYGSSFYVGAFVRLALIDRYKLVDDIRNGAVYLFDVGSDPGERVNLAGEKPEVVADLRMRVGRIWDLAMNNRVIERRVLLDACRRGHPKACSEVTRRQGARVSATPKAQPDPR